MNWRGRPLASHEVIVNSIAATTTRTGLTVHAELDPGSYPTGTEISDAQMAAVPLARHRFHGDWNYTIHPRPVPPAPAAGTAPGRPAAGVPDRAALSHPTLTGMSRRRLDDLIAELAGPQETQREQARHQRRGTERRRAAGAGPRPRLTHADRVLATVLYLRKLCTQAVLGELFAVDRSRITEAIRETRPLLEEHGHAITPATARFPAPSDLAAFLAVENINESVTTENDVLIIRKPLARRARRPSRPRGGAGQQAAARARLAAATGCGRLPETAALMPDHDEVRRDYCMIRALDVGFP
jgi:hypothetical protein